MTSKPKYSQVTYVRMNDTSPINIKGTSTSPYKSEAQLEHQREARALRREEKRYQIRESRRLEKEHDKSEKKKIAFQKARRKLIQKKIFAAPKVAQRKISRQYESTMRTIEKPRRSIGEEFTL